MQEIEETFCAVCGHVIDMMTVGGRIDGHMYTPSGQVFEVELFVCGECWAKMMEIVRGGMSHAERVRDEWMQLDKEGCDR